MTAEHTGRHGTYGTDRLYRVDADFAAEILADLYTYRRKRRWLAYLLWGTLGIVGAHRFYLNRPLTGLVMMFTLGGGLVWWFVDGFLVRGLIQSHDAEQALRQRSGLPPVELAFMPQLSPDVLATPPEWTHRWRVASRGRRYMRFLGDVTVLAVTAFTLGVVARAADVWEAPIAILVLAAVTVAGAAVGRFAHVPIVRGLVRWSHRLRLFYYYSTPRSPLGLLFRPVSGALLAPFRRRDRAEVRLYLQLGAVFTALFLVVDFGAETVGPVLAGQGLPSPISLLWLWLMEATVTFVVIFGFATPIGAVLNLYLLMMRTHVVPRVMGALVAVMIVLGLLA
jgi:hypothetical protein